MADGLMLLPFLKPASSPNVAQLFATTLWTGNASARTITSGINVSTPGGLVWIKRRGAIGDNVLTDTLRGATNELVSNTTGAAATVAQGVTAFGTTGFNLGTDVDYNDSAAGNTYVAWSFARAARFFDVVTYTGNNTSGRSIPHNLGAAPGLVLYKDRDNANGWFVYHRSLGSAAFLRLNLTNAQSTGSDIWDNKNPDASNLYIHGGTANAVNESGVRYIAYLFAHDTASDGIVQCGSYVGNDNASGPTVSLGWNPQFVMIKRATGGTGEWVIFDTARGIVSGNDPTLCPHSSSAENAVLSANDYIDLTGTGFQIALAGPSVNALGDTYVYLAIRSA